MTDEEADQLIADCEARESRLSDWEGQFIDSIAKQRGNGRHLSEKQAETLERIWNKATEKG